MKSKRRTSVSSPNYIETNEQSMDRRSDRPLAGFVSVLLILLEQVITMIVYFLPRKVIIVCTDLVKSLYKLIYRGDKGYGRFVSSVNDDALMKRMEALRDGDFQDICEENGFVCENHLVFTEDGYGLTIHRLDPSKNGYELNGKAVFLQHGLLMSSEIWCVMLDKNLNIPFRLCQQGYDVFVGNNRGNKYSSKQRTMTTKEVKFWNFSIDEFALYDIPACINYVLKLKGIDSLSYIGFSQGCSQVLASLSVHEDLNKKIEKLVLIAPATTPKKLSNWLIDSIVHLQPRVFYLLFGHKILMKSILLWQQIVYPPMFVHLIDFPNQILFDWHARNIAPLQKLVSYNHLYTTTSVKCVVHWFQIIRANRFQMYQDSHSFVPFEYPISTMMNVRKVLLIYGTSDSLVDINVILNQLPEFDRVIADKTTVDRSPEPVEKDDMKVGGTQSELRIHGVKDHEHLDLIWGRDVDHYTIQNVLNFLG